MEVRLCDSAVLDSLPMTARQRYQSVLTRPQRRAPVSRGWSTRPGVGTGAAHLRVALHRRLIVLRGS